MNGLPEADLESLQAMEAQMSQPSALHLQVIQEIGQRIGLDPEKILAGTSIQFKGIKFWLSHHGRRDPDGLSLLIDMGSVSGPLQPMALRQMLEHNALTPAALSGYYCMLPGTDTAAFCVRMDIAKLPAPCDAVLAYVGLLAKQLEQVSKVVETGMEAALQQMSRPSAGEAAEAR